jgi:hypothetical protein
MIRLAFGFVAGYVLGAKAGRERYEQIKRLTSKTIDHPAVQGAAGFVRAKISTGFSLLFSRDRQPARPDMAYLDQEPPLVGTGSPATVTPISA